MERVETDVLIVGAGPAGLATAIAARQKGLRVTVVDHRTGLIDKPCGEGLLPEGVAALRTLGVELNATVAWPFVGLQFSDDTLSAQARFPFGRAWGVRRTTLHQLLVARATELSVDFVWSANASFVAPNVIRVGEREIRPRWLVGADGVQSSVRRAAGISTRAARRRRFGFRRHYAVEPWSAFVEVYWTRHAQVSVTPTSAQEICVSLLTANQKLRIEAAIAQFPALAARLRGAPIVSAERGALICTSKVHSVSRGSMALVGDAAGAVDAITGLGMSLAFQQSLALVDALSTGRLAAYEAAHKRVLRTPRIMNRLLLAMSASPTLRRRVLKLFAAYPDLFPELLGAHVGARPDWLKAAVLLGLGWRILWA